MKTYVIIIGLFLFLLNYPAFGQSDSEIVNDKICLQRSLWGKTYFIYKGEKKPVGKYYSNLLPIMENTPAAYLELKKGISTLRTIRSFGCVVVSLSFAVDLLFESPKQDDLFKYISYPLLGGGLLYYIKKEIDGSNKIKKAIEIFNGN